jgi:hypothetical protein
VFKSDQIAYESGRIASPLWSRDHFQMQFSALKHTRLASLAKISTLVLDSDSIDAYYRLQPKQMSKKQFDFCRLRMKLCLSAVIFNKTHPFLKVNLFLKTRINLESICATFLWSLKEKKIEV